VNAQQKARLAERSTEGFLALAAVVKEAYSALRFAGEGMDQSLAMTALERGRQVVEEIEDFVSMGSVGFQWEQSGKLTGDAAVWPPNYEKRKDV